MQVARRIRFRLAIPSDELLRHYQGEASDVIVQAEDGRTVRFPAVSLRRFVTHDGVHGRFELRFSADNRLLGLQRIGT